MASVMYMYMYLVPVRDWREICPRARTFQFVVQAGASVGSMADGLPSWAEGLVSKGTYFEGVVEDAQTVVTQHTNDTVTTFGTRTSRKITKNKVRKTSHIHHHKMIK